MRMLQEGRLLLLHLEKKTTYACIVYFKSVNSLATKVRKVYKQLFQKCEMPGKKGNHVLFSFLQSSNKPGFVSEQACYKILLNLLGWNLTGDYMFQCHGIQSFWRKNTASDLTFYLTWLSTLTFQNAFFFRVHPDHNDDGRISSTCCHDSHSGGKL